MRVVRWRKSDTGVESFTITATGVYFPVGKTDSSFKLKLSMAAGGQTAAVDTVRDATGTRTGYGAMNVSGTTETKLGAVVSLATGIIVTAISGTLTPILDDEIAITTWPEWGIGRFPAKEDADAYVYGSNPPVGLTATLPSGPVTWRGVSAGGWSQPVSINSVGNRWVWDGDSITNGFGGVQTVAAILNGKMVIAGNVAVPGERIDQMLARLDATLALGPDGIWLQAGTNDAGIGRSPADFAALLNEYIDKVQGAGVQLILSLIPPRSDANNLNAQKINNATRRVAGLRGIPLCDPWETFRANDGTWVSGASGDNVHPLAHVLVPAAQSANAQLSGWLNSIPSIYPSLAQPDGGLRTNNLFLTDTNADGLADGINAASGATNSLSNATLPKLGKVQRFTWAAYAGDANALIFGGAASPGDRILAIGRIGYDPQGSTNTKLEVKFMGDFGAKTHGYLFGGSGANFRDAFSGVYAIEFTTVAASTSADMNPSMNRVSGGTLTGFLEFSQVQFYNLTALGLA